MNKYDRIEYINKLRKRKIEYFQNLPENKKKYYYKLKTYWRHLNKNKITLDEYNLKKKELLLEC
jgi:hypothetical protein